MLERRPINPMLFYLLVGSVLFWPAGIGSLFVFILCWLICFASADCVLSCDFRVQVCSCHFDCECVFLSFCYCLDELFVSSVSHAKYSFLLFNLFMLVVPSWWLSRLVVVLARWSDLCRQKRPAIMLAFLVA